MACTCTNGYELGDDLNWHLCVVCRPPRTTGQGALARQRIAERNPPKLKNVLAAPDKMPKPKEKK